MKGGQQRRRHTRRGRSKENFRCRMVTVTDAWSCRQTEWARVAHWGGLQWCRRYGGSEGFGQLARCLLAQDETRLRSAGVCARHG
jgi:hypothetical protein